MNYLTFCLKGDSIFIMVHFINTRSQIDFFIAGCACLETCRKKILPMWISSWLSDKEMKLLKINGKIRICLYIWKVTKIGSNIDICFSVFLSLNWQVNRDTFLGEITFCEVGKYQLPVCWWAHGKYIIGAYVVYFWMMKYFSSTEKYE